MNDYESDRAYGLYIKEEDRAKALTIIKNGLFEYLPKDYFHEHDEELFQTSELCSSKRMITFSTLISNIDELTGLSVDGRGKSKILGARHERRERSDVIKRRDG